jgi:hypothetical protein
VWEVSRLYCIVDVGRIRVQVHPPEHDSTRRSSLDLILVDLVLAMFLSNSNVSKLLGILDFSVYKANMLHSLPKTKIEPILAFAHRHTPADQRSHNSNAKTFVQGPQRQTKVGTSGTAESLSRCGVVQKKTQ